MICCKISFTLHLFIYLGHVDDYKPFPVAGLNVFPNKSGFL